MQVRGLRLLTILLLSIFIGTIPGQASDENFSLGFSLEDEGLQGFHLSIGEYFRVPRKEVLRVRDRIHDEDELAVIFFIAKHAHVKPAEIVKLREQGHSWRDISLRYRINPDAYYYAVPRGYYIGPYGHAYGHLKHDHRNWKDTRLNDRDIVNLVNLRYITEHHGYPPDRIMKMRSEGRSFVCIQRELLSGNGTEKQSPSDTENRYRTE
jgi:hypothetical protein